MAARTIAGSALEGMSAQHCIRYNPFGMRASTTSGLASGDSRAADWIAPALAFVVCFFSFGVLLSRLGFFQDDWHHVFYAYWQGAQGLQRFLLVDRGPFAWTVYALFFKLLGFAPVRWHWALMLLRLLTVLVFWLSVRQIWPRQRSLTAWLALIFAIYPIFTLQPLAVAYTLHWVMYLVFMVSLLLMLRAVRHRSSFIPLTIAALVLEAGHLAFIEYFSGLELCRPIFLWLLLSEYRGGERWRKALKYALPYLVVLALYVVYRSSYAAIFGYDRFTPLATLTDVVRAPITGLQGILQSILQDLVYVILSQWYAAVDPAIIDFSRPSTFLIIGSLVGFAALGYLAFRWVRGFENESGFLGNEREVALAGLVCVALTMLPFWLTGFSIYQKNQLWSERLALAAMPGASMLVVGTIYTLVDRNLNRFLALSLLLGIGVGLQAQIARNFQASWDKQEQFYWQLHWRAPSLKANTLLVSDQEILFYMGIYPTAFALNMLYPQSTPPPVASYWFNAGFEHMNFDKFAAGSADSFEKYATTFTGSVGDVLAITFEPGKDQCLWVLGPQLTNARVLTPQAATWLTVSNPSRIQDSPEVMPPAEVFGREPQRTWCYYFEKADLASQYADWSSIAGLWNEAKQRGLHAANGIELLPFIAASAQLGDWAQAKTLTTQAQALPDRSTSVLCDLWRNLGSSAPASEDRDQTVPSVQAELGCQK
jgi:hypothetical protein